MQDKNTAAEITAALADIKLFTASEDTLENADLTWTYKTAADNDPFATGTNYLEVHPTQGATGLVINVELANIGTAADQWTKLGDAAATTFYYIDDVESGGNTNLLVKSVQLDKDVTQNTFIAFDFDLNVNLESIQVTTDTEGVEQITTVYGDNWAATTGKGITGATASAPAYTDTEITSVTWTAK